MLIPVILSGGAGTLLWAVSREGHPKPFMKAADTARVCCLKPICGLPTLRRVEQGGEILTVTNREAAFPCSGEINYQLPGSRSGA